MELKLPEAWKGLELFAALRVSWIRIKFVDSDIRERILAFIPKILVIWEAHREKSELIRC
jgi:hypothetical protein